MLRMCVCVVSSLCYNYNPLYPMCALRGNLIYGLQCVFCFVEHERACDVCVSLGIQNTYETDQKPIRLFYIYSVVLYVYII